MKIGIYIPDRDIWKPSYRFFKALIEGLSENHTFTTVTKDDIKNSHNIIVPEFYSLIYGGLSDTPQDKTSFNLETKNIYFDSEVDSFLSDHEIHLVDRTYYDANQQFIYYDGVELWQV